MPPCSNSTMTAKPTLLNVENFKTLLNKIDTVLLDCDGVLWRGNKAIDGSVEAIKFLQKENKQVVLLTNNSTKSQLDYFQKCVRLGFTIPSKDNIITTSRLVANFFHSLQPKFDGKIFIIGSQGIANELDQVEIPHFGVGPDQLTADSNFSNDVKLDPKVKAVIVGFDAHFSYPKLLKAASYLKNPDCLFVATNDDETIPETAHPDLICPGTGCFVSAVKTATGREPIILGKPNKYTFEFVSRKFKINPGRTLMVGDRIRTDMQLAANFGMHSLLVLSGVTKTEDFNKAEFKNMLPEYYAQHLGDILNF